MRSKVLPVILPPRSYAELERQARASERDPIQQARWLLRQALEDRSDGALPATEHPTPELLTTAAAGSR